MKYLSRGHGVAKGLNAGYLGVFQPILFFKRSLADQEEKLVANWNTAQWARERYNGAIDMRKMIGLEMAQRQGAEGLDLLDLSGIFSNEPRKVFVDLIHITGESRRWVAEEIFKHLNESGVGS
mgnify:CR=1 FL=1